MKNDQYFEVGDKVMRVARIQVRPDQAIGIDDPEYGLVYCVTQIWRGRRGWNLIKLAGMRNSSERHGYLAINFRRVEEIQLCVSAAKHVNKPELEPA
jgi:hypothetical protein